MKTIIKILFSACIPLFFFSCEDDSASEPMAAMTINQYEFGINESMIINFTGFADQAVVFTGDDMHDYEYRTESNTGFVVNKGLFSYSYSVPGIYKVVCVASTYSDMAKELKQDTCSFTIRVTDDVTEIDKLSCSQVLYDEVFADRYPNDEWFMVLPRRVKYSTSSAAISITSQRLRFYIGSDSTKVFINNAEYSNTQRYDLSSTVDVQVRSDYGTTRPYKLHTVYYPEFETFSLAGVAGTLVRTEFDYSYFEMQLTLPTGTDVRNLTPEFTLYSDNDKVYIGNTEQMSGSSSVNFSDEITYRLVSTLPENSSMQAISTVIVKISYQ